MQLGATKKPLGGVNGRFASTGLGAGGAGSLAEELEREAAAELDAAGGSNAWGEEGEDLMDVNADADDWSKSFQGVEHRSTLR